MSDIFSAIFSTEGLLIGTIIPFLFVLTVVVFACLGPLIGGLIAIEAGRPRPLARCDRAWDNHIVGLGA